MMRLAECLAQASKGCDKPYRETMMLNPQLPKQKGRSSGDCSSGRRNKGSKQRECSGRNAAPACLLSSAHRQISRMREVNNAVHQTSHHRSAQDHNKGKALSNCGRQHRYGSRDRAVNPSSDALFDGVDYGLMASYVAYSKQKPAVRSKEGLMA